MRIQRLSWPVVALMVVGAVPSTQLSAELISFREPFRTLAIELDPAAVERLRQHPRREVSGVLRTENRQSTPVHIHLKGAAGSFRPIDDRPSFTLSSSEGNDVSKIHLENSAEDPGLLHQWLGAELFRESGIPTPRVTHARLMLNGRTLGLYVVREGYDEGFLLHNFGPGVLGEPEIGQDVGGHWRWKSRSGPGDLRAASAALSDLSAACGRQAPSNRWDGIAARIDVSRFATLLAGEVLLEHRDGYSLARNNVRIYWSPQTGRLTFLPHGMDQLLVGAGFPQVPNMAGDLARAFLDTVAGRQLYGKHWEQLAVDWMAPGRLTARVTAKAAELEPHLTRAERTRLRATTADLVQRIERRCAEVAFQRTASEPKPARFDTGPVLLQGWTASDAPQGGSLNDVRDATGRNRLFITAGPVTAASWQTRLLLPAGRYLFEGRAGVRGVQPLNFGRNQGAALRVSGERPRSAGLTGDSPAVPLSVEFTVGEPGEEVRLTCELRGRAGEAWFEAESLRIVRLD